MLSLRSIYCDHDECRLISPRISFEQLERTLCECQAGSPATHSHIVSCRTPVSVNFKLLLPFKHTVFSFYVTFELSPSYPGDSPVLVCQTDHLAQHCIDTLLKNAVTYADTLKPDPCMFQVLEWLKDNVFSVADSSVHMVEPQELQATEDITTNPLLQKTEAKCELVNLSESKQTEPHLLTTYHSAPTLTVIPNMMINIIKIDHMRNERKYFKVLQSWARELALHGKVFNTRVHAVFAVLIGSSCSLSEFLRRWRTQSVDVDSQGRPCKEKLLSVLCQCPLEKPPKTAW